VVGGYRIAKSGKGVGSLLLGLYNGDGDIQHMGATSAFPAQQRLEILEMLRPLEGGTSFSGPHGPGGPSRWNASRPRDMSWVPVRPELACEVAFDHLQGHRFRHLARFLRWRPDKDPRDCTWDQLVPPHPFSLEEIIQMGKGG
jgi:ATP-dependent DNA ligase